ncbi:MAG: S-methyl-5'-thioadenosine phosphorylase [Actinobacteria bacterium]|nr:S-methyl-5'-thioadenosine phosphorylase [Actinomycetota bacterium]
MDAEIGIIGGSGLYSFLADATTVLPDTPFGPPSAPLTIGEVAGRRVAFVPRHGRHHEFPPHAVNYRANLWALRSVGVRQVLAPAAVGSLRPELGPGTFVVPDQVIDRTWGRPHTVHETAGHVVHVAFADPYCPRGRAAIVAASDADVRPVDGGTLVVINGPRFSTRAESRMNAAAGGTIVGMTGMPEAIVARELALCYSTVCLVTDHDAGVEAGEAVTHAEVLAQFAGNIERMKALLTRVIAALPAHEADATATCTCRHALDGQQLGFELP